MSLQHPPQIAFASPSGAGLAFPAGSIALPMPFPLDRTRLRRGRLCRAVLASALVAGGCESWKSAKVDHPVLGPPPPRMSWNEPPADGTRTADASGDAGLVRVSLTEPGPITDYSLVALVNGEPIVAGEILAPFDAHFVKFAAQGASDRQIEELKKAALKQHLDRKIEETLLVQSLKLMLKAEQWKQTEEKLDQAWEEQNRKIMAKARVNSKVELEQKLAEGGASLFEYEQGFKKQQLAQLFLSFKTDGSDPVFGRQDVVDYYNANVAKYEHPARAQFQLLMIAVKPGEKDEARAKVDEAVAELRRGTPFPDVAKRYSDHPTAAKGGQHDWFKPGEFAVKEVDEAIFSLPVGQMSEAFETAKPAAFMIVKVTDRQEAGRTPLAEVQEEIRSTLQTQARQKTVDSLLAKLHENAVVTKYVD